MTPEEHQLQLEEREEDEWWNLGPESQLWKEHREYCDELKEVQDACTDTRKRLLYSR